MHMTTSKKRINVSVSPDMEKVLYLLAQRDGVPLATKAATLLQYAIDMTEDEVLASIALERAQENTHFISHDEAWGNV